MSELTDILGAVRGFIDPHLPPYNAKGDCIHGHDGVTDGTNRIQCPGYTFTSADIGKKMYTDLTANGAYRTIVAIGGTGDPNACTLDGSAFTAGTNHTYLFGTDDTVALQAALDDARYSQSGGFVGNPVQSLYAEMMGRAVMLRSGRSYLVSNSSASYNSGSGKTAALYVHRRTALVGGGMSYHSAEIIMTPGSYGDVVSNENGRAALASNSAANSYTDFITIANLTINGYAGISTTALSGLFLYPSYNGYLDTDPQMTVYNVRSYNNTEHGFYIGGRGEMLAWGLRGLGNRQFGCYLNGLVDSTINCSTFGGNYLTGFRANRSQSVRLTDIKSWYSGKSGGTDPKNCANFVFEADQAINGKVTASQLDAQESRGSSFIFDNSGQNVLRACRSQDAGQQNNLNSGTLPTIRSGVHMMNASATENDLDIRVEAGVRAFSAVNFTGTSALAIDSNALGNIGKIEVQKNLQFTGRTSVSVADGAKIEGVGVSNGNNTRLTVDGVNLT